MTSLADRMKSQYEDRYRVLLPRRTYTVIRIDGKSFHTYTRGMEKPFDEGLHKAFDEVARALCEEVQGCVFAYQQSDEVSLLLQDFSKPDTDAWFDGNLQKIVSVASSIATSFFAANFPRRLEPTGWSFPQFDARAFVIPDPVEVENYFIWRQMDWKRNSLQMLARSLYSHKELKGKKAADLHEMIHVKGKNWADLDERWKNGMLCLKSDMLADGLTAGPTGAVVTRGWESFPSFVFMKDRERLVGMIPKHWDEGMPPRRIGVFKEISPEGPSERVETDRLKGG